MDAFTLWIVSAATLVVILAGIEGGYRLGRATAPEELRTTIDTAR